jgi:magnesium chelatase accessory protein
MADRLQLATDGAAWPHRDKSRLISAAGLNWHVQQFGDVVRQPLALLLHGTGASTHSFAELMPALHARGWAVLAADLPGHAFTDMAPPWRLTLPGMARAVAELLLALKLQPRVIVGHSAGAAVATAMALQGQAQPQALYSINGALLPLNGWAGQWFSPLAKMLVLNPLVPRLFAWRAADARVLDRLLASTGSRVSGTSRACYARLVASTGHAAGALGMMANWDLPTLQQELPRLAVPLHLGVGEGDKTIRPAFASEVQALLPTATLTRWPGLGHLAHEESPEVVAAWIGAPA